MWDEFVISLFLSLQCTFLMASTALNCILRYTLEKIKVVFCTGSVKIPPIKNIQYNQFRNFIVRDSLVTQGSIQSTIIGSILTSVRFKTSFLFIQVIQQS